MNPVKIEDIETNFILHDFLSSEKLRDWGPKSDLR
jgi:hypothetical protein